MSILLDYAEEQIETQVVQKIAQDALDKLFAKNLKPSNE